MSRIRHGIVTMFMATLLTAATLLMTGCALFARPDSPEDLVAAAASSLSDIRAIVGVDQATVDVDQIDSMVGGEALKDPNEWIARFSITVAAGRDLVGVSEGIDDELTNLRETLPANATLVQEGSDTATVVLTLGPSSAASPSVFQISSAAGALRTVPAIDGISLSTYSEPLNATVADVKDWESAMAGIRNIDGFGDVGLQQATLVTTLDDQNYASLAFDSQFPAAGIPTMLAGLIDRHDVASLNFDGARPVQFADGAESWRPRLSVETSARVTMRTIADALTRVPDAIPAALVRTSFTVSTESETGSDRVSGFLGLPIGSPEPADILSYPVPAPPPVDPIVAAAELERGRVFISTIFQEAGDAAGISGLATETTAACADGRGQQISAGLTIPIFEITDSADTAYEAITAGWVDRGFTYTTRALGTDIYTAATLERLDIRGTTEGIRVHATSTCTA